MDIVIGLGGAGCRIADQFSKYPQYEVYKIDVGLKGANCFALPLKNTPEEYENCVPDMSSFFKDVEGDVLFIIGGGGKISGASLQIMKQLKNCSINVAYIKPDTKSLTRISALQNRLAFNVLQEYARSGVLNKIYLIENTAIEKIIGDVPILEYNNKINETIVGCFHYINIFTHTQAMMESLELPKENHRISTIGILNIKDGTDAYLFPLQNVGHKCYYYAIPEEVLKTDGKLFKTIKEKVSEDHSSYTIHSTKHAESFAYFVASTNFIQVLDLAN